ncbi:MAG: glycosyltransferase family 9 protein [Ignavibacteria bacterium]|jgi:heptosyltransferase-2
MVQKILVIQTAFLGDAILTLPLIQKLYEKNQKPIIDVLCIPPTEEIFNASPYVNAAIVYDKKNKQKSILDLINLAKFIKRKEYTQIISPHKSFRTSIIIFLSKVKNTTGFNNAALNFVYKKKIKYIKTDHEVKRNLKLIDFENDWKIKPEILVDAKKKEEILKKIPNPEKKEFIAIAPGSVWKTKEYPLEYFKELIIKFIEHGKYIVLIGSKSELRFESELLGLSNNIHSFIGKLSIIESIYLLTVCKFLMCNDSAPTHMAMCAGIPSATLYCSTVPEFGFYPYNKNSLSISFNDLDCKPCGIHGYNKCPEKTFSCGYKLLPDFVFNEIKSKLMQE